MAPDPSAASKTADVETQSQRETATISSQDQQAAPIRDQVSNNTTNEGLNINNSRIALGEIQRVIGTVICSESLKTKGLKKQEEGAGLIVD